MLLKDSHYTWLKVPAGESVPEAWLKESVFPDPKDLQGAAKGSTQGSNCSQSPATPSVHTVIGKSKKARKTLAHVGQGSEATPSVHSLVRPRGENTGEKNGSPTLLRLLLPCTLWLGVRGSKIRKLILKAFLLLLDQVPLVNLR